MFPLQWHTIVYCLNLATTLLPQQTFLFGCFTNLFLFGWNIYSDYIFSFCIFPPIQPSAQISNAEMLIRAFFPPWLTLLSFSEVFYKLWITCSDHLCHLDPGLRRNLDMTMLRFMPLQIWGSEAPKTVSEWERCNASLWPDKLRKTACLERVKHSVTVSQILPMSWAWASNCKHRLGDTIKSGFTYLRFSGM